MKLEIVVTDRNNDILDEIHRMCFQHCCGLISFFQTEKD